MTSSTFDSPTALSMRQSMATLTSGVCVVSAHAADGGACGMTINSMTSISLDPAILLVSLTLAARTTIAITESGRFAVSVLSVGQEDIAQRFATRSGDRFEGLRHEAGLTGLPVIAGALAQMECRVRNHHVVADHRVFYGDVTGLRWRKGTGLAFASGRFGSFRSHTDDDVHWLF
jgi:flavin reductase (DIM6/NTAB) family NADH-FMN oxidoreductase RutF